MNGMRSTMRTATFTFWEVSTGDLPVSWQDAQRRLDEQASQDAAARTGSRP